MILPSPQRNCGEVSISTLSQPTADLNNQLQHLCYLSLFQHWQSLFLGCASYAGSAVSISLLYARARPLYRSLHSDCELVAINQALESAVWRRLRESVCGIVVPGNPTDLRDLASLV